ncbi:hypothetical protein HDV05_005663 [Chytridiales sp. JEL 0842]|nr:hypothetical protein HDV05_005663 [Chytridiales sp. JEL 0842]
MATRSRTVLFVQYRSSFSRATRNVNRPNVDTSESAGLIANEIHDDVAVEMSVLPPKWVDIVGEFDEEVENIKIKITELEGLHRKHLLPGFDDRIGDEQSIERLTSQISNMFQGCQRTIKRVENEARSSANGSAQVAAFGKNLQISLASKLQDVSGIFRKTQSAYLSKLRGRETRAKDIFQTGSGDMLDPDEDEALDAVFTDAQLAIVVTNERAITEREREINEIVKSINGIAEVFKEINQLVIDQGTILDRIDYNIEQVGVHMEAAHGELVKINPTAPLFLNELNNEVAVPKKKRKKEASQAVTIASGEAPPSKAERERAAKQAKADARSAKTKGMGALRE